MSTYPPPPPPGSPYGSDWRYQRRALRDQAKLQREAMRMQRDQYRAQIRGMRRTSIVGPLLMILLGIVFLLVQTGRLSSTHLWSWYSRWWPLLLIGAGVIRLAEWSIDQSRARNAPQNTPFARRALGGGVIFLLILLASAGIAGTGLHNGGHGLMGSTLGLNEDSLETFLGDKHESDEPAIYACPAGCMFTIDSPRGDVAVSGTSDDGQIHVSMHKLVYTRTDSEAARKSEELSPRMTTSGNLVTLALATMEGGHADVTVTLPPTALLSINANHGDVRVASMHSPVTVTANHGDVDLSAIYGPVKGHINNGDSSFSAHSITGPLVVEGRGHDVTLSDLSGPVRISGEFFGTTHLEHVRGPVGFHTSRTDFQLARLDGEVEISPNADLSADQALGPILLNTRNRNITMERVSGDVSITNRNGTVDVTSAPPLGNLTVENRNGTVNLTLPNDASFVAQADTTNGDVESDFGLPSGGSENHPSLSGTVNHGGPLVRVSTSQGDVSLKKARVAPLPPTPPPPPKITAVPSGAEDAREAAQESRTAAKEAAQEARAAQKEAAQEAKAAQKEAAAEVRAAQEEMRKARQESERDAAKAKREAGKEQ